MRAKNKAKPHSGLFVVLRDAVLVLVFWSVWVAMSSPRGTKILNSRLMDVIRALLLFECCHARSQLENAHIITFQLVRNAEIWVRDGFGAIRVETAATHA